MARAPDPPEEADPLMQQIRARLAARGQQETAAELRKRATDRPQDARAQAEVGVFEMMNDQVGPGRTALERAAALGARDGIVYYLLSSYYLDKQEYDKAADFARHMVALAPKDPYGFYNLGRASLRMEELHDSIAALAECTRLAPGFATAYQLLGNAYFMRSEFTAAEQALRKCVEMDPDNAVAWDGLGRIYLVVGSPDGAEDAFRHALALAPDRAELYAGLGRAYLLRPDVPANADAAVKALSKAVALDPSASEALFYLGEVYRRQGELPRAEREYRKALGSTPDAPRIRYALAQVLLRQGKDRDAAALLEGLNAATWSRRAQFLQREIDIDPGQANVRYELGTLYAQEKQYGKAMHQYRMLARLEPGAARAHVQMAGLYERIGDRGHAAEERALAARRAGER